jgi:hypothetical protein
MFTLQTSYKPVFLKRGGGVKSVVELTVNNKEENSSDFCPNTFMNSASVHILFAFSKYVCVYAG